MKPFDVATLVFALVGAAVYFGIIYFAGRKGWWWLALLVSLPAMFALITYFLRMPHDQMAQSSSLLFRYFGTVGIVQLIAGTVVYLLARSRSRAKTAE